MTTTFENVDLNWVYDPYYSRLILNHKQGLCPDEHDVVIEVFLNKKRMERVHFCYKYYPLQEIYDKCYPTFISVEQSKIDIINFINNFEKLKVFL